jgi:hypothetical protein
VRDTFRLGRRMDYWAVWVMGGLEAPSTTKGNGESIL